MSMTSARPGEPGTLVAAPIPRGAFLYKGRYVDVRPALWGAACTRCGRIHTSGDMYDRTSTARRIRITPVCLHCRTPEDD